eukprot:3506718-Rhodomonas_salina.1
MLHSRPSLRLALLCLAIASSAHCLAQQPHPCSTVVSHTCKNATSGRFDSPCQATQSTAAPNANGTAPPNANGTAPPNANGTAPPSHANSTAGGGSPANSTLPDGCIHTASSPGLQWWRLDLNDHLPSNATPSRNAHRLVSEVLLWTRGDPTLTAALANFSVWVSDTDSPSDVLGNASNACYTQPGAVNATPAPTALHAPCGMRGRYLWISVPHGPLTLCGVEALYHEQTPCHADARCAAALNASAGAFTC